MKKALFVLPLFFCALFFFPSSVHAALITVNPDGQVIWNVLAAEDSLALGVADRGDIKVSQSADGTQSGQIKLKKVNDKLYLNDLDVTDWDNSLVEIEERGSVKKISIGLAGGDFTIEQNGIVARSGYPITVNPRDNELSVTTQSGAVYLSVLPLEAAESALRSKFVNKVDKNGVVLSQEDVGVLAYTIPGQKIINILGVYDYEIPVVAKVSASTGEVLAVDGPSWFKVFGFLFS